MDFQLTLFLLHHSWDVLKIVYFDEPLPQLVLSKKISKKYIKKLSSAIGQKKFKNLNSNRMIEHFFPPPPKIKTSTNFCVHDEYSDGSGARNPGFGYPTHHFLMKNLVWLIYSYHFRRLCWDCNITVFLASKKIFVLFFFVYKIHSEVS